MRKGGKFLTLFLLLIFTSINLLSIKIGNNEISHNPADEEYLIVKDGNWFRSSERKKHNGIDLDVPKDAPIYAVENGTVVKVKKDPPGETNERIKELQELIENPKTSSSDRNEYKTELNEIKEKYGSEYSIY